MIIDDCRFAFQNLLNCNKLKKLYYRHKSFSSEEWLKRREADLYIAKAKRENYRCRSAFKLLEIDDRFKIIQPGHCVLDVGAAPGSWSQILSSRTNSNKNDPNKPKGLVIAIDKAYIHPLEGVIILSSMDFTQKSSQEKILEILGGHKLDFVFSDMAPLATGVKSLDQENIIKLLYPVLLFSVKNLKLGGGCLMKIWEGQHLKFVEDVKKFFNRFNYVRPNATYDSSSETYILGREFLGLKNSG